jgi:hypothetical protein
VCSIARFVANFVPPGIVENVQPPEHLVAGHVRLRFSNYRIVAAAEHPVGDEEPSDTLGWLALAKSVRNTTIGPYF